MALKKQFKAKFRSMNVERNNLLMEAIDKTKCKHSTDLCVYNPDSYLNLKIIRESEVVYLDEAYQETQSFKKLNDFIVRQYNLISHDFPEQHIELQPYDFDDAQNIAGNVMLYAVLPNDNSKTQIFIKRISELALHFGYNYVAHDVDDMYAKDAYEVQIQFEASYFPGNVKVGDILWHVTTKNLANKIVNQKKGLTPRTESKRGFHYSPRIYCFKVLDRELMQKYAKNSWKSNRQFVTTVDALQKIVKSHWIELVKKEHGALFDTKEFSILKIDTQKLSSKFYRDNTFEYNDTFVAVYTTSNIPASAIEIAETFEI